MEFNEKNSIPGVVYVTMTFDCDLSQVLCRCGIAAFEIYQQDIDTIEYMQNVEPLRCVALNTIIPLGIGILRNATQRKYLQWEKHSKFVHKSTIDNNPALF